MLTWAVRRRAKEGYIMDELTTTLFLDQAEAAYKHYYALCLTTNHSQLGCDKDGCQTCKYRKIAESLEEQVYQPRPSRRLSELLAEEIPKLAKREGRQRWLYRVK
jgi:hypothetical protein